MTSRNRLSAWWFDVHQRGMLMHCPGMFWPCLFANIEDALFGPDSRGFGYMWHWRAVSGSGYVDQAVARARRIRALGWGIER